MLKVKDWKESYLGKKVILITAQPVDSIHEDLITGIIVGFFKWPSGNLFAIALDGEIETYSGISCKLKSMQPSSNRNIWLNSEDIDGEKEGFWYYRDDFKLI